MITWQDCSCVFTDGNWSATQTVTQTHSYYNCIFFIRNNIHRSAAINIATIRNVDVMWHKFNVKQFFCKYGFLLGEWNTTTTSNNATTNSKIQQLK